MTRNKFVWNETLRCDATKYTKKGKVGGEQVRSIGLFSKIIEKIGDGAHLRLENDPEW